VEIQGLVPDQETYDFDPQKPSFTEYWIPIRKLGAFLAQPDA